MNGWKQELYFNPETDYSSQYGSLFGASTGGDLHYSGPNANWRHAIDERINWRAPGQYHFGHYENSASRMDRDQFTKMTQRNNVIESMLRSGYSWDQLNDHMSGARNVLEDGPARDPSAEGFLWSDRGQTPAPGSAPTAVEPEQEFDFSTNPLIANRAGGGGFLGAYNAKRAELENKPSVMSLFKEMENYEQSPQ